MSFFLDSPGALHMEPFNIYQWLPVIALIIIAFAIVLFREELQKPKVDKIVRIAAIVVVFTLEAGYHISNLVHNTNFFLRLLPLHLCEMSLWIALFLNITKKRFLFSLLYFWGIGSLAAFIYPGIMGMGRNYYQFFATHGLVILTIFYFIVVFGQRVKFIDFILANLVLLPVALIVRAIDVANYAKHQTDWMFLITPPTGVHTVLEALPQGGWTYFSSLSLFVFCVFIIAYLPWGITYFVKRRKSGLIK